MVTGSFGAAYICDIHVCDGINLFWCGPGSRGGAFFKSLAFDSGDGACFALFLSWCNDIGGIFYFWSDANFTGWFFSDPVGAEVKGRNVFAVFRAGHEMGFHEFSFPDDPLHLH